jgi:transcriptional regulator with XRE-family HTH domain
VSVIPASGSEVWQLPGRRSKDGQALSLFADMLREARHKAEMTSDDLGDKLGYSGALVRSVESGHRVPKPDFARRADQFFGYPGFFEAYDQHSGGHDLDVAAQPLPAAESVLAGDDKLRGAERELACRGSVGIELGDHGQCVRVAGADRALQLTRQIAELAQVRVLREGHGRQSRPPFACQLVRVAG